MEEEEYLSHQMREKIQREGKKASLKVIFVVYVRDSELHA